MEGPRKQVKATAEQKLPDKLVVETPAAQEDKAPGKAADDILKRKSRAAQKRFRARVKAQKEGIEDQLAVLSRRIDELKKTQASLEIRNRSLTRFVELSKQKNSGAETSSEKDNKSEKSSDVKEWHRLYVAQVNRMRGPAGPVMTLEECMASYPDPGRFLVLKNEVCMEMYKKLGFTLTPEASGEAAAIEFVLQTRKNRVAIVDYLKTAKKHSTAQDAPNFFFKQAIMQPTLIALARSIHLSLEQKQKILAAKASFLKESAWIWVQRQSILKKLRQSYIPHDASAALQLTMFGQIDSAQEAQNQLQDSLATESAAMRHYAITCTEVATPLQEAMMTVEAYIKYGLLVDTWDIANVLETKASTIQQEDSLAGSS